MSKPPETPGLRLHQRAVVRVLACASVGLVAGFLCPMDPWVDGLLGWDVGATLLLIVHVVILFRSDVEQTRQRAAAWDPCRFSMWVMVCGGCVFSLAASLVMIGERDRGVASELFMGLCIWAVLSSWFLTHSTYTLRYAHLFYRGDEAGGLVFPGGCEPDDLAFSVSDVGISDRVIRRNVLLHALISFFYNTAILALALNMIFGHISHR